MSSPNTYSIVSETDLDRLKTTVSRVLATLPDRKQIDEMIYLQKVLEGKSVVVQAYKLTRWLDVNGGGPRA